MENGIPTIENQLYFLNYEMLNKDKGLMNPILWFIREVQRYIKI
jgi:hypothetical protein